MLDQHKQQVESAGTQGGRLPAHQQLALGGQYFEVAKVVGGIGRMVLAWA